MATHVALVHHPVTGNLEPATQNGVPIVGEPFELRAAFGRRVVRVDPAAVHYDEKANRITVSEWFNNSLRGPDSAA